ncbi:hypothetical protein Dip510_000014 [Elusimicrobium posterum]|uniref:hypothetical protein n=1 Tax=Elusimicrobium posterum TaxID=3116653 RepID=UPI003C72D3EF
MKKLNTTAILIAFTMIMGSTFSFAQYFGPNSALSQKGARDADEARESNAINAEIKAAENKVNQIKGDVTLAMYVNAANIHELNALYNKNVKKRIPASAGNNANAPLGVNLYQVSHIASGLKGELDSEIATNKIRGTVAGEPFEGTLLQWAVIKNEPYKALFALSKARTSNVSHLIQIAAVSDKINNFEAFSRVISHSNSSEILSQKASNYAKDDTGRALLKNAENKATTTVSKKTSKAEEKSLGSKIYDVAASVGCAILETPQNIGAAIP